jgi:hypothetical protein
MFKNNNLSTKNFTNPLNTPNSLNTLNALNKNNAKNVTNNTNTFSLIIKILVIAIVVILIIYFCYKIITDFVTIKNNSPYFIQTITDGNSPLLISASKIPLSVDAKYGTEFTYSFWIFIKDTNFTTSTSSTSTCNTTTGMKNIFVKGSSDYSDGNLPLLQSPGLWLYPDDNKLAIIMNTYNNYAERCDIGNVPINKWVNMTIMLIGNSLDVYVNCNLKKRCKLSGVPKQNYEDLRISNWGGFAGYLSKFRYYNYALEPYQISQICSNGPSSADELVTTQPEPPYLSDNYWTTTGFPKSN